MEKYSEEWQLEKDRGGDEIGRACVERHVLSLPGGKPEYQTNEEAK